MIQVLLSTARECKLSFEEVFKIFFDYGIVDSYGNETEESKSHLQYRKGSI